MAQTPWAFENKRSWTDTPVVWQSPRRDMYPGDMEPPPSPLTNWPREADLLAALVQVSLDSAVWTPAPGLLTPDTPRAIAQQLWNGLAEVDLPLPGQTLRFSWVVRDTAEPEYIISSDSPAVLARDRRMIYDIWMRGRPHFLWESLGLQASGGTNGKPTPKTIGLLQAVYDMMEMGMDAVLAYQSAEWSMAVRPTIRAATLVEQLKRRELNWNRRLVTVPALKELQ